MSTLRPSLADRCRALPSLLVARRCGGCGEVLPSAAEHHDRAPDWCGHCRDRWGPVPGCWDAGPGGCAGWAAAEYRGRVRRSILLGKRGAHGPAAQLLLARWPRGPLDPGVDLTWVPGHPRRTVGRPDAGRALAMAVARHEGLERAPRALLSRSPSGRRQAGLTDAERREDPRALGLRLRATPRALVVIVDDVRTTGTTLDWAAALLRAGGAREVFALVVAGAPSSDR